MAIYFLTVFMSFLFNFVLIVPFINLLYKTKIQRAKQETKDIFNKPTPIFDRFHNYKQGKPVGGGILITLTTVIIFSFFISMYVFFNKKLEINYPSLFSEIKILLFTFISFALLGVYDDLTKIFFWQKKRFFGIRMRHKLIIEIILALIVSFWLYSELKIDIIHIPFIGVFEIGWLYIAFAAFVIISFANAVNITDGLDGLAGGILMIALMSFWTIASSILDSPTSIFIASWLGGLIAFLYFNIYPARLMLGDTGALSFGATFAVIGLILGKAFALPVIGGVFLIEILSSFIQIISKKFRKKKAFPVAPFHLWLQLIGWEEPKIVMRLWIIEIIFVIIGLMFAFSK